mgnify:CR=1 FL=1
MVKYLNPIGSESKMSAISPSGASSIYLVLRYFPLAFSGVILSYVHSDISKWEQKGTYTIFVFIGIIAVYSLHKYYKLNIQPSKDRNSRMIFGLISCSSAFLAFLLFFNLFSDYKVIGVLSFVLLITFWYVYPLFGIILRQIKFLKGILVALVWTIIVVWIPFHHTNFSPSLPFVMGFFFYVLALTIPFDIRDVYHDGPERFTIPQFIGISRSKVLSVFLMFLGLGLVCLTTHFKPSSVVLSMSILLVYAFLLYLQKEDTKRIYYTFFDCMLLANAGLIFFTV